MEPLIINYEMGNGETVPLCLTYRSVYKLRTYDKKLYKDYNEAQVKLPEEPEYYQMVVLYAAYIGGTFYSGTENPMTFDEFVDNMNQNRKYNARIYQEIYAPNPKKASAKRS